MWNHIFENLIQFKCFVIAQSYSFFKANQTQSHFCKREYDFCANNSFENFKKVIILVINRFKIKKSYNEV